VGVAAGLICAILTLAPGARAGSAVGDIQVVYLAPNGFNYNGSFNGSLVGTPIGPSLDAPAFVIENTSGTDITNGVLQIAVGGNNGTADSFNLGTIAAHSYVIVVPGLSDDGGANHTFFKHTGTELDTSDTGPNSNAVPFSFTGLSAGQAVNTGIFTPAATDGPSNDLTATVNFLGNEDLPCNNCFGPKVVAQISFASVPEPASWLRLGAGATGLIILGRARRWRGDRD
jgi:hypothetical protein